ncbi:hypothetical protein Dimus_027757 [Dionaea muscipula]
MDMRNWGGSGSDSGSGSGLGSGSCNQQRNIVLGRRSFSFSQQRYKYDRFASMETTTTTKSGILYGAWRNLMRRLRKQKKRVFGWSPSTRSSQNKIWAPGYPYDPHTYSQNFDEGYGTWADPDNLSRSFSARFAVSSS